MGISEAASSRLGLLFTFAAVAVMAGCHGAGGAGSRFGLNPGVGGDELNLLLFSAEDSQNGVEPWVSDGTALGTDMLMDINGGTADSDPEGFTRVKNLVIFTARTASEGRELWVTDGDTITSPSPIILNPGQLDGVDEGQAFPVLDEFAYFRGDAPNNGGEELWRTDGSVTERVADIRPGPGDGSPHNLAVFDGHVFFAATDGQSGVALWRTDGTTTERVLDPDGSGIPSPADLTVTNGDLYFTAETQPGQRALWIATDRNSPPSQFVTINAEPNSGAGIRHLTAYGQGVAFAANDGNRGFEIWLSEGTAGSTDILADINTGPDDGVPPDSVPFVHDGRLYFAASDDGSPHVLWTSVPNLTATPQRVTTAQGVTPTLTGEPDSFTALNGAVFFAARRATEGRELWRANAPATLISLVEDINTSSSMADSDPAGLTPFGELIYFSADDGTGRHLWRTDANVTELVVEDNGPTNVDHLTAIESQQQPGVGLATGGSGSIRWRDTGQVFR